MRKPFLMMMFLALWFSCGKRVEPKTPEEFIEEEPAYELSSKVVQEALAFSRKHKMNSSIFVLADLSVASRKKRFFLVSMKGDSVILSGLVTHGHCQEWASLKAEFSNVSGSNCSSVGKYKIGFKYEGSFGTAYKLHGLDETNSNAFDRFIVLHSHPCVPDEEQSLPICRSEGCPTVSPVMLEAIQSYLDASKKPVLLWIMDGVNG